MKKIKYVSSDVYQVVKPDQLNNLKYFLEAKGPNSLYPFRTYGRAHVGSDTSDGENVVQVLEGLNLSFTNQQVVNLLEKALLIVSSTEEGVAYTLKKLFDPEGHKERSTPPGTLRFYSQRHICFYTGKNWRKIVP